MKTGLPAGRNLINQWRPDVIFSSGPPFTAFLLAHRLGREFSIPWIADFRDLWVDDAYYNEPFWRRPVDILLESTMVRSAAAVVTVSPLFAQQLEQRYGKPVATVCNGYSAEDFPSELPINTAGEVLTIRHMGTIYLGYRDPSPLFAAIGLLPPALRDRVRVEFWGDSGNELSRTAMAYGVADRISSMPRIPYREALELQGRSDVLLLLQWNDTREAGNLPAKLFEYIYARRPLLMIGYERGIAAGMVRERAGFVSCAPECICAQLRQWIEEKQAGRLSALDPSVYVGLSRDEQFAKLEQVFALIADQ